MQGDGEGGEGAEKPGHDTVTNVAGIAAKAGAATSSDLSVTDMVAAGRPRRRSRKKRSSHRRTHGTEKRARSWTVVMWWLIGILLVGWTVLLGVQLLRATPEEDIPAFEFSRPHSR